MKEKIIEILKRSDKQSYSLIEINDLLGFTSVLDLKKLEEELNKLIKEGMVYYSEKKKTYLLLENTNFIKGILDLNKKGFGFVSIGKNLEDVFINEKNLNGALDKDTVLIEIIDKFSNEGRIVRVINHNYDNIIGEYYEINGIGFVKSDDGKNKTDIEIPKNMNKGAVPGHKVIVKPFHDKKLYGEIIKIIGHKNDVGVDILSIVYAHDFDPVFSEEVMNELDSIPDEVKEEDLIGRVDLRDNLIFTIDGSDTKDIDDAISLEKLKNGNYKLGVHIADVSHYVKENTAIGKTAYERGTSVYLVDRVIPMLPHKLSNGICSLNEDVDRLAMSCVMEIDGRGKVVNYDIFKSVIRSRKQMTYDCVNQILEENIVPEGYFEYKDTLLLMKELADILRREKITRGYLEFESSEAKILVDEKGKPIDIKLRVQRSGENLIEDFMVVANETVASHNFYQSLPSIYRVHDRPNPEKLRKFLDFITSHGYVLAGKRSKEITPVQFQNILKELKPQSNSLVLNDLAIRSQAKAIYSETNTGHFGLGSKCYTHFTSPIRRYPDLTLHRILKSYMDSIDEKIINKWGKELPIISEHSSKKEIDAVECERDVDKMKKAEYMESHIGETFKGYISGVSDFGLFVMLENTVEGLIKIETLPNDYYIYDNIRESLIGKRSGRVFNYGDTLMVKVISASKENMTVDFMLEDEFNEKEKKKIKDLG